MKKSTAVPASLIIALAATVVATGCSDDGGQDVCVDSSGRNVPDTYCQPGSGVRGAHYIHTGGFGGSSGGYYGG